MVLETDSLEDFLHYHTIEFSQMEKSVTENGSYTAKNLTRYFVLLQSIKKGACERSVSK